MACFEERSLCDGCSYNYFKVIAEFYEQESKSISFLRQHGVLPYEVFCKFCDSPCTFREKNLEVP